MNKENSSEFLNPMNFLEQYKEIKKEAQIKQCLYPNHSECTENIIRAHSIQNNKILKQISSNGDVYMPYPKLDNPFAIATKWGRKQATVFTGFCGYHDNEIFKPIENYAFDKSELHTFLYTYRSFAVSYHRKQENCNMNASIFKRIPSQMKMFESDNIFKGIELGFNDLLHVKDSFDKALLEQNYDILTTIVWEFPYPVKFAATGFEAPTTDLYGNKIQDLLNQSKIAEHIFITIFPDEEKTYCIISWLKANNDLFSGIYEQLNSLGEEQRKVYLNNTLPIVSENIAINPDAWDSLEQYQKDEFGSLIWELASLGELEGVSYNRLSPPTYDLFAL